MRSTSMLLLGYPEACLESCRTSKMKFLQKHLKYYQYWLLGEVCVSVFRHVKCICYLFTRTLSFVFLMIILLIIMELSSILKLYLCSLIENQSKFRGRAISFMVDPIKQGKKVLTLVAIFYVSGCRLGIIHLGCTKHFPHN